MQYIVYIKIYNLDRNIILCNIYVKGKNVDYRMYKFKVYIFIVYN